MASEVIPVTVNLNRLLKKDILWLYNHKCKHKVRYTQHPQCFLKEWGDQLAMVEKIAFLDTETSRLEADYGYIICYSIKELDGKLIHNCVTPDEIHNYTFDKRLLKKFIGEVANYNRLVVYYGKDYRFDVPFLRTRALKWNLSFPQYGQEFITDVFDLVKGKLRLSRNRMENACDLLDIPAKGHRLNPDVWQKAMAGSKGALDYIQIHCDEDVISLEALYKKLEGFGRLSKRSI